MPALRHGDTVVTETAAICAYLADAFPEAGLAPPPGDRLRGPYCRWLFFGAGPLGGGWTNKAMGFTVTPEQARMAGYGSLAPSSKSSKPRCLGDRTWSVMPSPPLISISVSHLGFGLQFGMIEKHPAFEAYVARVSARPAAVRAREVDDALTPSTPHTS